LGILDWVESKIGVVSPRLERKKARQGGKLAADKVGGCQQRSLIRYPFPGLAHPAGGGGGRRRTMPMPFDSSGGGGAGASSRERAAAAGPAQFIDFPFPALSAAAGPRVASAVGSHSSSGGWGDRPNAACASSSGWQPFAAVTSQASKLKG
jgi:hypothetical protein